MWQPVKMTSSNHVEMTLWMSQSSFKLFKTFQRWSVPAPSSISSESEKCNSKHNLSPPRCNSTRSIKIFFQNENVDVFFAAFSIFPASPIMARNSRKRRRKSFNFLPCTKLRPKRLRTPCDFSTKFRGTFFVCIQLLKYSPQKVMTWVGVDHIYFSCWTDQNIHNIMPHLRTMVTTNIEKG